MIALLIVVGLLVAALFVVGFFLYEDWSDRRARQLSAEFDEVFRRIAKGK